MSLGMRAMLAALLGLAAVPIAAATAQSGKYPPTLIGKWRVLSARVIYKTGGDDFVNEPNSTPRLDIAASGTWSYGSKTGTWSISKITAADWNRWDEGPYGPKTKLVLTGWPGGTGQGPIELSAAGKVTSLWVIFDAKPPSVPAAGRLHLKLGR
jgi:hypothetical protein